MRGGPACAHDVFEEPETGQPVDGVATGGESSPATSTGHVRVRDSKGAGGYRHNARIREVNRTEAEQTHAKTSED